MDGWTDGRTDGWRENIDLLLRKILCQLSRGRIRHFPRAVEYSARCTLTLVLSGLRCSYEFAGEVIHDLLQSETEIINIGLPAARTLSFCLTKDILFTYL